MRQAPGSIVFQISIAIMATGIVVFFLMSLQDITSPIDREIAASFEKIAAKAPRIK